MSRPAGFLAAAVLAASVACPAAAQALNTRRLEPDEARLRESTVAALDPLIRSKRKQGTAALLTWQELYEPLSEEQRRFLDAFRALRAESLGAASGYFGELSNRADIVPVDPQRYVKDGQETAIDRQYLPRPTLEAYQSMMDAMQRDLGRRLLVESGYRSPAYQLYLFLFYMPNHDLSILESTRHIALPGHSEHGYPPRQAVDFINEEGINGEYDPDAFEALPEFTWLKNHAAEYGFVLSYPRDNDSNSAYEPWHWRHEQPGS